MSHTHAPLFMAPCRGKGVALTGSVTVAPWVLCWLCCRLVTLWPPDALCASGSLATLALTDREVEGPGAWRAPVRGTGWVGLVGLESTLAVSWVTL